MGQTKALVEREKRRRNAQLKTIALSYLLLITILSQAAIPYGFITATLFFLLLAAFQSMVGWKIVVYFISFISFDAYLWSFERLLSLSSILMGSTVKVIVLGFTGLVAWGIIMVEYLIFRLVVKRMNLWKRIGIKL